MRRPFLDGSLKVSLIYWFIEFSKEIGLKIASGTGVARQGETLQYEAFKA
jgi:hypothetical protein